LRVEKIVARTRRMMAESERMMMISSIKVSFD
jgi:hypothetical protein